MRKIAAGFALAFSSLTAFGFPTYTLHVSCSAKPYYQTNLDVTLNVETGAFSSRYSEEGGDYSQRQELSGIATKNSYLEKGEGVVTKFVSYTIMAPGLGSSIVEPRTYQYDYTTGKWQIPFSGASDNCRITED